MSALPRSKHLLSLARWLGDMRYMKLVGIEISLENPKPRRSIFGPCRKYVPNRRCCRFALLCTHLSKNRSPHPPCLVDLRKSERIGAVITSCALAWVPVAMLLCVHAELLCDTTIGACWFGREELAHERMWFTATRTDCERHSLSSAITEHDTCRRAESFTQKASRWLKGRLQP